MAALGGAIRKWAISSGALSNIILLVQMLIPFLMVFYRSSNAVSPFKKYTILTPYLFYLVLQVISPLQVTPFHGILGIIIHGGFWFGMFFYFANRHLFQPAKFMNIFFIVCVAEIILGFVQYGLPSSHFLNKYSNEETAHNVAMVGDRVRITGTFSYLSGFTAFMLFYTLWVWALIRLRVNSWIVATAMVFGAVASFMTGSRSGTVLYILLVVPMIINEFPAGELTKFGIRLILPTAIGFTILILARDIPLADVIGKAYDNFFGRVKAGRESGEEASRLVWDLSYFTNNNFKYPIMGIGTGSTYQGAIILFGRSPYEIEFGYAEGEFIKNILEGGIILLAFKIILASILVSNLSFKGFIFRAVIWFMLIYAVPIVFNPHNAAFLFLGLVMIDNIIWRQQIQIARKKMGLDEIETDPKQALVPL